MPDLEIDRQTVTDSVSAAFPGHSREKVEEVLRKEHFNVDAAAEHLLTLPLPQHEVQQRRRQTGFLSPQASFDWPTSRVA